MGYDFCQKKLQFLLPQFWELIMTSPKDAQGGWYWEEAEDFQRTKNE